MMRKPFPLLQQRSQGSLKETLGDNAGLLITLSDITLLLLCCLLIWHVMDKQDALRHSLPAPSSPATALSVLPASAAMASSEVSLIPPVSSVQDETIRTAHPPEKGFSASTRWAVLKNEMEAEMTTSGLGESIGVISTQHELLMALKETVLFDSGKADLNASSGAILDKVAAFARNHTDLALEVLGHTDEVPIATAEFPSNWELSAARASRVARLLVTAGVAPTRLSAQGYASFRPLAPNDSNENRTANRRVEIRFYHNVDKTEGNQSNEWHEVQVPYTLGTPPVIR